MNKTKHKGLHSRNLHQQGYDFPLLTQHYPLLAAHVRPNTYGQLSIDFADPVAVKTLNAALLQQYYNIEHWDIPIGALCPPIPGRVDYIHYIAELLGVSDPMLRSTASANAPSSMRLLDIGTGANGIYSLLASQIYGWHCVGSDINPQSLENVTAIIDRNPSLKDRFTLRQQHNKHHIFNGVIQAGEFFDVSVCNPPFHASLEEALKGSQRKRNNLARNRGERTGEQTHADSQSSGAAPPTLNFGGLAAELWCNGGERLFLKKMMKESQLFSTQCRWFTSLVSKSEHLKEAQKLLRKLGAVDVRVIDMTQGNKMTRILAWTFI